MIKIRRQLTFLLTGTISIQSVFALDSSRFPGQAANLFSKNWEFITRLFQNPWVRQGLSLIALLVILYNIYNSIIKKISVFSESSNAIAAPLAIISTLAIVWKVPMDTISKMFLILVIAVAIIYLIKGLMKVANLFKGGFNPNRAIKDEKRVIKESDESEKFEKQIIRNEDSLEREMQKERYDTSKMKSLLDSARKSAESGQKDVKKIFSDTKRS